MPKGDRGIDIEAAQVQERRLGIVRNVERAGLGERLQAVVVRLHDVAQGYSSAGRNLDIGQQVRAAITVSVRSLRRRPGRWLALFHTP